MQIERRKVRVKIASPFIILAFWISSWFPTAPNEWAIFSAAICVLGLAAAILARVTQRERRWPALALLVLAACILIGGAFFAFLAWAVGTRADGAIALFFILGLAGYLHMIAKILTSGQVSDWYFGPGSVVLLLLGCWSWVSALGMYVHRGVSGDTDKSCILEPNPVHYDTELNFIWEMRLPEIVTSRTGPTGTTILDYHAILVAPSDEETQVYNWSKRWMRFDVLDKERNPYLPTTCP